MSSPTPTPTSTDSTSSSQQTDELLGILLASVLLFLVACGMFRFLRENKHFRPYFQPRLIKQVDISEQASTFQGEGVLFASPPTLERGWFAWMKTVLSLTEEFWFKYGGLDAMVFVHFMRMSIKIFSVCAVITIPILLPVYATGDREEDPLYPPPTGSLDRLSLSNVIPQSNRLWAPFVFAYVITFVCFYFIHQTYGRMHQLAVRHKKHPRPENFAVLVQGVPPEQRDSEEVCRFFNRLYGDGAVLGATMAQKDNTLRKLVREYQRLLARLDRLTVGQRRDADADAGTIAVDVVELEEERGVSEELHDRLLEHAAQHESEDDDDNDGSSGGALCCCCSEERVGRIVKRMDVLREKMQQRLDLLDKSTTEEHLSTAFLLCNSIATASQIAESWACVEPDKWETSRAPQPKDVYWPNMGLSRKVLASKNVIAHIFVTVMIVFWAVPVSAISTLTNLVYLAENCEDIFGSAGFCEGLQDWVAGVGPWTEAILNLIPVALLKGLMSLVPDIMLIVSRHAGISQHSARQWYVFKKYFSFQVVHVFFVTSFTQSVMQVLVEMVENPSLIPSYLAQSLPRQAAFFINYIILSCFISFGMELVRDYHFAVYTALYSMGRAGVKIPMPKAGHAKLGFRFPTHLLVFMIATTYAVQQPLILPFAAVYFLVGLLVWSYLMLYVYEPKFETGGCAWPMLFDRMIFSLVLFQLMVMGVLFGWLSVGMVPLIIATLRFRWRCHGKFKQAFDMLLPRDMAVEADSRGVAPALGTMRRGYLNPSVQLARRFCHAHSPKHSSASGSGSLLVNQDV